MLQNVCLALRAHAEHAAHAGRWLQYAPGRFGAQRLGTLRHISASPGAQGVRLASHGPPCSCIGWPRGEGAGSVSESASQGGGWAGGRPWLPYPWLPIAFARLRIHCPGLPSPVQDRRDGRRAGSGWAKSEPRLFIHCPLLPPCRISVMGGEQAATVLHLVELDKRQREGRPWPEEEQEEFKRRIRERWGGGGVCGVGARLAALVRSVAPRGSLSRASPRTDGERELAGRRAGRSPRPGAPPISQPAGTTNRRLRPFPACR